MNKLLIAALSAVLFVGAGCQMDGGSSSSRTTRTSDRDGTMTTRTERTETMRGQDDCDHCPGTQTAKADGTCPICNAKVRSATR